MVHNMRHHGHHIFRVLSVFFIIILCRQSLAIPSTDVVERISIHSHQPSVYHIYVGATPVHHHAPALVASSVSAASVTQQVQTPAGIVGLWQRVKDAVKYVQDTSSLHVYIKNSSWWSYIMSHKWSLGIKTVGCMYCCANYYLFSKNTYLAASGRWFSWKRHTPLTHLMRMQGDDLVDELIEAMRLKQTDALRKLDRDEIARLISAEMEAELKALEQYRWCSTMLQRCDEFQRQFGVICEGCIPSLCGILWGSLARRFLQVIGVRSLFYLNQSIIDEIPAWLDRLRYLREVIAQTIEQTK